MKAAIIGVGVLPPTRFTQRKVTHRSCMAIVGEVLHDGEPWPAICAARKRVVETAIAGVTELLNALFAGRHVRRNRYDPSRTGGRWVDAEFRIEADARDFGPLHRYRVDKGERRTVRLHPSHECPECGRFALGDTPHASAIVAHSAADPELAGQPVNEGTEANALHRAQDSHLPLFN